MNFNRLTLLAVLAVSATAARSASSDEAFTAALQEAAATAAKEAFAPRAPQKPDPKTEDVAQIIARVSGAYSHEIKKDDEVLLADTLDIAPDAAGSIRFNVSRQSYEGGHASCGLSGVAKYRNGRFVFTDTNAPILSGQRCVLEIRLEADRIELEIGRAHV